MVRTNEVFGNSVEEQQTELILIASASRKEYPLKNLGVTLIK